MRLIDKYVQNSCLLRKASGSLKKAEWFTSYLNMNADFSEKIFFVGAERPQDNQSKNFTALRPAFVRRMKGQYK